MSNTHLFALFSAQLPTRIENDATIIFTDTDAWLRITQVLRLTIGSRVIVFNQTLSALLILDASTFANKKNIITGIVKNINYHVPLQPAIHLIVGLTKREAFENILYTCAQMGVASVTPVLAKRIHRNWITEKDAARLKKIMIAGCEQGKQFVLPTLNQPHQLTDALSSSMQNAFICSPGGNHLLITMQTFALEKPQSITLLVGPEGGFDESEEQVIAEYGVLPVALGKSILRSQDAVQVIVGVLRSIH